MHISASSLRKQGPIRRSRSRVYPTSAASLMTKSGKPDLVRSRRHSVWALAFARTTLGEEFRPQASPLLVEPIDIAAVVDRPQVMQIPPDQRIEARDLGRSLHSEREHVLDRLGRGVGLGLIGIRVLPIEVLDLLVGIELEQAAAGLVDDILGAARLRLEEMDRVDQGMQQRGDLVRMAVD